MLSYGERMIEGRWEIFLSRIFLAEECSARF